MKGFFIALVLLFSLAAVALPPPDIGYHTDTYILSDFDQFIPVTTNANNASCVVEISIFKEVERIEIDVSSTSYIYNTISIPYCQTLEVHQPDIVYYSNAPFNYTGNTIHLSPALNSNVLEKPGWSC